jgi:hypothetical protein
MNWQHYRRKWGLCSKVMELPDAACGSAGRVRLQAMTLLTRAPALAAGAGLLKWVLAMVNYYNVAKGVEPKRKKVAEAEKNLRLAQKDLADTKDQLAALNAQLTSLRSQFADKTAEQQVRDMPGLQQPTTTTTTVAAAACLHNFCIVGLQHMFACCCAG